MTANPSDTGYAPDRWKFDDEVTRVFEDMLWRSIPGYAIMRQLCGKMAQRFASTGSPGTVVDLGCSRGGAIAELVAAEPPHSPTAYLGVEVSDPMIEAARARFAGNGRVRIDKVDLRTSFPEVARETCSVVLAVLTLQFVPIEHRARVVRRAFEALAPGGAMVLVEKILGGSSWADDLLVTDYYDFKRSNGYTQEDIDPEAPGARRCPRPVDGGGQPRHAAPRGVPGRRVLLAPPELLRLGSSPVVR